MSHTVGDHRIHSGVGEASSAGILESEAKEEQAGAGHFGGSAEPAS